MAITSVGYDGAMDENDVARWMAATSQVRVVSPGGLTLSIAAGDRRVNIGSGFAFGDGVRDDNSAALAVQLDGLTGTGSRWDTIWLERDFSIPATALVQGGATTVKVTKGSQGAARSAPVLPVTADKKPHLLGQVQVTGTAAASQIASILQLTAHAAPRLTVQSSAALVAGWPAGTAAVISGEAGEWVTDGTSWSLVGGGSSGGIVKMSSTWAGRWIPTGTTSLHPAFTVPVPSGRKAVVRVSFQCVVDPRSGGRAVFNMAGAQTATAVPGEQSVNLSWVQETTGPWSYTPTVTVSGQGVVFTSSTARCFSAWDYSEGA